MPRRPAGGRTAWALVALWCLAASGAGQAPLINGHAAVVDESGRLITWMEPHSRAFGEFLRLRWEFVKRDVPPSPGPAPRSSYPLYYFYDGYRTDSPAVEADTWMNDVGEKVPNWFESARLYYAFSGDESVLKIALGLLDYAIEHGTSPAGFAWPRFPYTTTDAGDLEFRGFTSAGRFVLHEIQVDHAAEMGLAYYRAFLYTGDERQLVAARAVADVLARTARVGSETRSVWPYRVVMDSGRVTAEYGANWTGAHALLGALAAAGEGDVAAYRAAAERARVFLLGFPMRTGYWTDGHSDTAIDSHTYRSNLSKSNAALYLLDNPGFDPDWRLHVPELIRWTEVHFVERCAKGEPASVLGANIVGEQDDFLPKMDYQTARYAAETARWYAASGDAAYREKALRSLSFVTYCSDARGRATESPYSKLATWFSDCYGEAPRMFYHAFAAVPEWAPPGEDHILYSKGVLREVAYDDDRVRYRTTDDEDVEYLRLAFRPAGVTIDGRALAERPDLEAPGYTARPLGGGDWAIAVRGGVRGLVALSRPQPSRSTAAPRSRSRSTRRA